MRQDTAAAPDLEMIQPTLIHQPLDKGLYLITLFICNIINIQNDEKCEEMLEYFTTI